MNSDQPAAQAADIPDEALARLIRDVIALHWKANMTRRAITQHLVMNGREDYQLPSSTDFIAPVVDQICDAENSRIAKLNAASRIEYQAVVSRLRATPAFANLLSDIGRAGGAFRR